MKRAFTLIELLIVVSIIAILASIAVPNFLEAQVRAKVSRVKAEHAVIALALETYHVDNNRYPETNVKTRWERFQMLTTPIAYITTVPTDPFLPKGDWQEDNFVDWGPRHGYYKMACTPLTNPSRFAISSNGPDLDEDSVPIRFYPGYSDAVFMKNDPDFNFQIYDPTNGTISDGDVWRLSDKKLE
jgi:prepilin-type N-terminal cleavage/methylation domain-containing protein